MIKGYKKKNNKIIDFIYNDFDESKVAVDVLYCGICGTDYQKYIGMDNVEEWGHEIIGKVNDNLVTIRTTYPCEKCIKNNPEKCKHWKRQDINGFSNKVFVDNNSIINLNEKELDLVYALIEPLYVANNLIKHVNPSDDSIYTVVGNGTIGLLSAFLIKEKYNSEVRVVGRRNPKSRADFIKKINANYYEFNDIKNALNESNKIIITTPYNTIPDILKEVDSYSNVTFNGISKDTKIELEMDKWHFNNLCIWPSFPHPQSDFEEEIKIIKENKDILRSIITDVYDLDNIEKAFKFLNKKQDTIKILIKCKE